MAIGVNASYRGCSQDGRQVDPVPPGEELVGTAPLPALMLDMGRAFRQLGVQSLRASVVDIPLKSFLANWSITDTGEIKEAATEGSLDSVFPGATSTVDQLAESSTDETLVQKLGPRHWGFAWRVDDRNAIVTEAQFSDRREAVSTADSALVRLVCSASIHANQVAAQAAAAAPPRPQAPVWPQVERRARPQASAPFKASLALTAVAAVFAVWLVVAVLPLLHDAGAALRAQTETHFKRADGTLVQGLSRVLATGDYGDVQDELSSFGALGYFHSAVVTNARGRVIATSGAVDRHLRMGEPVTPAYAGLARMLELQLDAQPQGKLLLVSSAPSFDVPVGAAQAMALTTAIASVIAAALLAVGMRRRS